MARALGRYELLRPLARGGMAEVYLARRRAAGIEKWLVVKRMRPERSGDPRFLDLFVREARLSMSLVHQNIVPVFDFGRIDDQVFLAMERVEGKDLGSSLARAADHRLPPLLAAFVAAECCQALDYAHQRKSPDGVALGIVHRDVTPRNVLLSWSGEVKLTDFGIAALAGDATSRLLGTPQYMAPEQARSEPIDPRADIYAVGLVLREAMTGARPRPGTDRDGMLDAARRGTLMPWPHQLPDAELALGSGDHSEPPPAALVAIIERAAAAAPADRYPDARTMLEALDAFIVGERAANKGDSPARQLAAWLTAVWDGARDDAEADAAIQAEHMVSFLDDGAIDVVGTGTMRSLAATAADDVPAAPPAASPAPPAAAKTTVIVDPDAASGPRPVLDPPPALRTEGAARQGRTSSTVSQISSSTTTVASGTFRTVPSGRLRKRGGRTLAPALSLVAVALAAGAIVFWVMTSLRDRDRPADGSAAAAGGSSVAQVSPKGSADAGPRAAESPANGLPANGRPAGGQPAAEQPTSGQVTNGHPVGGQPASGHPVTGHPTAGPGTRPTGSRNASPAPDHGAAHPIASGTPAGKGATSPDAGSVDGSSAEGASPAPPPRPPMCKVRINLTPWAYYTADDSSERHETPGTIDLTPGPHRLHVWNPELHVERDIVIQVPADRDSMNYSEPLQPTSLRPDAGGP
ncbi:MAG TPA: protein kinase [Kofleriaceae bacterium]|jgi:tRNA A-37 threonylcarbamoyl transferase component Bud32|nr:protein kinase [Kofleriaceae bacterium]